MANDILTVSGAIIAPALTPSALSFDWRAVASVALIVALGMLIVFWKRKGNNENAHAWIYYIGAVLGLCGGAMGIYYGLYKSEGLTSAIVGASFVVMALYRAVGMDTAVNQAKQREYGAASIGAVLLLLCWLIVYAGGSFEGQADGAAKLQDAAATSPEVRALDAQLVIASANVAKLGQFADASAATDSSRKLTDINARLDSARKELANCPPSIVTRCINPKSEAVHALEAAAVAAGGYMIGAGDLQAARAVLADLETKRTAMLKGGGVSVGKVGQDAAFVAWATGKPVEDASRILWMVIVGVLDVASTLAHLYAALSRPREDYIIGQCVNQVGVLLRNGFTQAEVFHMLGNRAPLTIENKEGGDFEKKQLNQGIDDAAQATHVKVGLGEETPQVKVGQADDLPHVKVGNAVCEDCATSFTRRVSWQVRCPDCQAKKRALNATGRRAKVATA
jgi:hypothetical protein